MSVLQLTLDGREVPWPGEFRPAAPLSEAQREIVRWIRHHGAIRSIEAGLIIHAHRDQPCRPREGGRGIACCRWAAEDGRQALKRLAQRGMVHRVRAGVWEAGSE